MYLKMSKIANVILYFLVLEGTALLVQVVQCVWNAHDDFHSSLRGQLFDSCISFLPKRLRIILNGKFSNVPLLKQDKRGGNKTSQLYVLLMKSTSNNYT